MSRETPTKTPSSVNTDHYFTRSKQVLEHLDKNPKVVYRCFLRTDAIAVHKFVEDYLVQNQVPCSFQQLVHEGTFAPAKTPLFEIVGNLQDLIEHETSILQLVGWPSLCCYNACQIRKVAKKVKLIDMAARHCPGVEAAKMASYAAHIAGFDGCSTTSGARTFNGYAVGTMPHAIVGAFESTKETALAFAKTFPEGGTVLVDYAGREIDDAIACYKALGSKLDAIRIDTHGGRYCQGATNIEEEGAYIAITRLQNEFGLSPHFGWDYAYGKGVTIEAVYVLRQALDKAGAKKVKIVVSSGFGLEKVKAFMNAKAPIDAIGTGSFLPTDIKDTYATMDIVSYDGKKKIKVGREWLLK